MERGKREEGEGDIRSGRGIRGKAEEQEER